MTLLLELKEQIDQHYQAQLTAASILRQNALIVSFSNGMIVDVRYLNPDEYYIAWCWAKDQWQIDTAPLHRELKTFPNHLHRVNGQVVEDPLTQPGAVPWDNMRHLLDTLLKNPAILNEGASSCTGKPTASSA